jgi:hypothetical protein
MALALGIFVLSGSLANASDVVINNGFETRDWLHWETTGTLPVSEMTVELFDIKPGISTWCFHLVTYTGVTGGLTQNVFVQEGVTYTVSADFAYETC